MGTGTRNDRISEEKIEYLRMYTFAVMDPDIFPSNIPSIREKLKDYEDNEEVRKLDVWLLEDLEDILNVNPTIQDDDSQPLEKWWWHLNKIAKGTYPKDLLPEYLRKSY